MDAVKKVLRRYGKLYYQPIPITGIVPASQGTGTFTNTDSIPYLISDITIMALDAVTGVATQDYLVSIKDSAKAQVLCESPVHGSHWGINGLPTHLPVPYWLKGAGSIEITVTSTHAGNNIDVYISFSGYKLASAQGQAQMRALIENAGYPYWFSVSKVALAANTTARQVLTNAENTPYLIKRFTAWAYDTIATIQTMKYSLYMKDSATQQLWMPNPVNGSAFGFNEFPTDLQVPYLLNPQSTLEVEITSNNANVMNIYTAFFGYRVQKMNY
jgi:hypothetical protein